MFAATYFGQVAFASTPVVSHARPGLDGTATTVFIRTS